MLTLGAILLAVTVVPSPWGWILVAGVAVVDVAETVVLIYWSKRRRLAVGRETMVGRPAVVTRRVAPTGRVRIDGELWTARTGGGPLEPGETVTVTAVDGLTLSVEPASREAP